MMNLLELLNTAFLKIKNLFVYNPNKSFNNTKSFLGTNTKIGKGTNINGIAFIGSNKSSPVSIGKYCAIGHNLRIRSTNHHTGYINLQVKFQKKYFASDIIVSKGPIVIGNNVWIGDNVIILPGVTIGDGAVVGAGSIVTKSIPAYAIAAGNPAKVIKYRFNHSIIEQLLQIHWWDWDEDKISRNHNFFETNFSEHDSIDLGSIIVD